VNPLEAPRRISFDLDTIAGVVRKKWWIVPFTMLIGFVLMFWQESDLQTEPRYFSLTRMYEPTDEGAPLTLVGINTDLISQYPNETSQALLLDTDEVKQKIQAKFDREITLLIKPFDKTFSLNTETDGAAITKFSFKPSRRFTYEFTCVEVDEKNCAAALDAYSQELSFTRLAATKAGFANSIKLIDALLSSEDQLSIDAKNQLVLQKNAFNQAINIATGEITQISESKYFGGKTVETVDLTTYIFGLFIGLVIGLLLLAQFLINDGKIRSSRALVAVSSYEKYLGELSLSKKSNTIQFLAASVRGSSSSAIKHIKIIPVGAQITDDATIQELATILGIQVSITQSISELIAADLAPNSDSAFMFAVLKDSAKISELKEIWSVVEKSGNIVLGSVLVSQ
jgi:hypothetical protein